MFSRELVPESVRRAAKDRSVAGAFNFSEKLIPLMILNACEGNPLPVWLFERSLHRDCDRTAAGEGRVRPTTLVAGTRSQTSKSGDFL